MAVGVEERVMAGGGGRKEVVVGEDGVVKADGSVLGGMMEENEWMDRIAAIDC